MNEHERTRTKLGLLLAGALSPKEEKALRAHIAKCADCSRRLEIHRQLTDAIVDSPGESPDPELTARIVRQSQSRRLQVIRERRQARQVISLALIGWLLVLISVPLWVEVLNGVREWLEWPGETGPVTALLAGAVFTYLFLPAIRPLLAPWRRALVREM